MVAEPRERWGTPAARRDAARTAVSANAGHGNATRSLTGIRRASRWLRWSPTFDQAMRPRPDITLATPAIDQTTGAHPGLRAEI
jgi:hypothetical protein